MQPRPPLNSWLVAMKSRRANPSWSRRLQWAPTGMLRGKEKTVFLLMERRFAQGTILLLLFIIYALPKVCRVLYRHNLKKSSVWSRWMLGCCWRLRRGRLGGQAGGAPSPCTALQRSLSGAGVLSGHEVGLAGELGVALSPLCTIVGWLCLQGHVPCLICIRSLAAVGMSEQ